VTAAVTRAMLLAAGLGERLRPLTERVPKPLIPVGGRPMVHYMLDRLAAAGIREVHVNTHHLGTLVREALGDGSAWGLSLCYHPETVILGTGGGLKAAAAACPDLASGPFAMVNADVLADADLGALCARHAADAPLATLLLRDDPEARHYGVIGTDAGDRIRRFLDADLGGTVRERMFTGIQVLSPGIFHYMPEREVFPITDAYKAALLAGARLMGPAHSGYWADLGTPERLRAADADLGAGSAGALTPAPGPT
jgi:NDP-sugar pyrophosphorylase family protein